MAEGQSSQRLDQNVIEFHADHRELWTGGLTFGDTQNFQDAVDKEGSIEALPVDVGLLDKLLGIR